MEGDDVKLHGFHGNEFEDPEQHRFLCEAMWTIRQVQDEAIKKYQMITNFQGWDLDWYINFYVFLVGALQKTLAKIQAGLKDDFKKSKFES